MNIPAWLRELGLERYAQTFAQHHIDAEILPGLDAADLKELGVASLGHRKRLLRAIADLMASGDLAQPGGPASGAAAAERRQLTFLICELVSSAALGGRLDPEDMATVMRSYHGCCVEVVQRWDGHVARVAGDAVLAYFGWPKAQEDAAERAVRAGLGLIEAIGRLQAGGARLAARIGIATGQVLVGDLLSDLLGNRRFKDAVVGEAPNLAVRLQAMAAAGSVVIGSSTRRLLGDLFELVDLGVHLVRDFAAPVHAWRVVGESRVESRFEALRGTRLTPLVGREYELAKLVERWTWAQAGDGQVVLIVGEPGIGKSRLIQALRERIAGQAYLSLSHHCSPFHVDSALHPVIERLERAAGLRREDPAEAQLAKLEALLGRSADDSDPAVPLIAALLSLPTAERYPALNLTPQAQKQRTWQVLLDQLAQLAARQPVLALFEDVHWIDPSTLELLSLTIERVRQLPVLVLISCRPDFRPPWTAQAHLTRLPLKRLHRSEGATMVLRLTGGRRLPPEVVEQIVARTDGVPLFVEELTKTVLESGLLTEAGDHFELTGPLPPPAIPATLHDSLMARLDRSAPVKEIAQIGAVIGREFSYELIAALSPLPEDELDDALDQLVAAELIFRRGAPPGATYGFKHILVQEAAYQSLLKARRQDLHARIAALLEERSPEIVATEPELIAQHCAAAGLTERAIAAWRHAGERAVQRSANREAISHLSRALELLATRPDTPDRTRQELALQTALGPALIATKGYAAPEVEATYLRARELSQKIQDTAQLFSVLRGLFVCHNVRANYQTAGELAAQLLELAQQEPQAPYLPEAHRCMGHNLLYLGEFALARAHLEQEALPGDVAEERRLAVLYGQDPILSLRSAEAYCLWFLGYPDQALARSREGLSRARELGHPFSLAFALCFAAHVHHVRREPATTDRWAEELVALASEQGFSYLPALGVVYRGFALAERGEFAAGIAQIGEGLMTQQAKGAMMARSRQLGMLAEALGKAGQCGRGLEMIEEAQTFSARSGEAYFVAELLRLRGELLLQQDRAAHLAVAEAAFLQGIEVARAQRARSWELRVATSLARLWAARGERSKACDLLGPIHGWFIEGFDTPDLQDASALLDALA